MARLSRVLIGAIMGKYRRSKIYKVDAFFVFYMDQLFLDCSACWAVAVISVVESKIAIKTGELVDLSEQELIDCDSFNFGCDGGFPDRALK